jgi:hypothetical protein
MKRIILIFFLILINFILKAQYKIKVFDFSKDSIIELASFNILDKIQKIALNDSLLISANYNAYFSEYNYNKKQKTGFYKQLIYKRDTFNGKGITDLTFVNNSTDFIITYEGGALVQYFKQLKKSQYLQYIGENYYKIKSDLYGRYIYFCTGYSYAWGGKISKMAIGETNLTKKKYLWNWRVKNFTSDSIPYPEFSDYQITNFDFNQSETQFVYHLPQINNLVAIDYEKGNRHLHNNKDVWYRIVDFKYINDTNILVVNSNGFITIGTFNNIDFVNPKLELDSGIIGIVNNNVKNLIGFVYKNKVVFCEIEGEKIKVLNYIIFKDEIVLYNQNYKGNKVAFVFKRQIE